MSVASGDVIDGHQSFLDRAEHLMFKCDAKAAYLIATHGVLSADSAKEVRRATACIKCVY
ncbi:hypothetical protein BC938DRAFT_482593 [Jimgerdemannia flammicorona]|uniref:Uncharacterized protein n=1 Tax=Jimgerdemannia flammicorona TaxID=994334 RepID=A0A433QDT9_9FUNG|nr:hypothetical protein BC938DRAFT_482593 [Jimgerdemannia flammicorona]